MISRIPRWAWAGSSALALVAGMVNVVGLMSFQRQGLTHLTGTTSLLGLAVATGDVSEEMHLVGVLAAFMAGCILAGAMVRDSTLQLGRRYGLALVVESGLLFAAVPLLYRGHAMGAYLASAAMGTQNGMVSTFSGAVMRTTHLTGLFTDLGILFGHRLRGGKVDGRKARLYLMLIGSFFAGSVVGAIGFARLGYGMLDIPAALVGCVGIAYGSYHHWKMGRLA